MYTNPDRPPILVTDAQHPWLTRFVDRLARHRAVLVLVAIGLTLAAIRPAGQLKLDERIESFYAPDDPDLTAWLDSKRWFGGDEFVMVAYEQPDLLSAEHLAELEEFAAQFRDPDRFPGVETAATQDLADVLDIAGAPLFKEVNVVVRTMVGRILRSSLIEFSRSVLIGEDTEVGNQSTSVMLRLKSGQEPAERTETLRRIRETAAAHAPPTYVAGEPVQLHDMFRYVEEDATRLGFATSGLLLVVIAVMFRSLRWVALPLLVVNATILWTRALLVVTQMKLSMVSSMLNSLVTIIGIATVMHVTVTFRELRRDSDRIAAFRETFVTLVPPVFWTTVTTAIGFLSLFTSEIVPVRSFGTMVTLGTLLILATCATILPGGILLGGLDTDPRDTPFERHVVRALLAITRRVEERPKLLFGLCLALMAAAALGLGRLKVETDFSKNFRSSSEVAQAVRFFESHLGGAGNWEVNFQAPTVLDDEYLSKVRQLARRLREIEMSDGTKLSKVYALTDGLDFIPSILAKTIDDRRAALRQVQPYFETQLYNPDAGRMRLYLRAREQKPAEIKLALIAEVERVSREAFPEARTTGLYVLIAKLITSLLGDQLTSFLVSATGIVVCMTVAFRNFRIGLASLLPNVFPILVLIGGMGWLDVPVNIGTAMIASVSMGLTIDTSIHYISGYRHARERGLDHAAAVRETHASVGRALVFANIALVAGFSALSVSNFIPLIYFGVLVSLAMVGGLAGNLVLLPLLLRWVPLKINAARA